MSDIANNAVTSAKRSQLSLITLCFFVFVAALIIPNTNTRQALQELEFIMSLSASGIDGSDILDSEAKKIANENIPREYLDFFDKGALLFHWEENQKLRSLKENLPPREKVTADDVFEFMQPIIRARELFSSFSFNTPPHFTQANCIILNGAKPYAIENPNRLRGDQKFTNTTLLSHVWSSRETITELFAIWDSLETVWIWTPKALKLTNSIEISYRTLVINLPIEILSTKKIDSPPCIGYVKDNNALQATHSEVRILENSASKIIHSGVYVLNSENMPLPGVMEGSPWFDFYAADGGKLITPSVTVNIKYHAKLNQLQAQNLLVNNNPLLTLPDRFSFGRHGQSFPALTRYVEKNQSISDTEKASTLFSRIKKDIEIEKSGEKVQVFGASIPIHRIGIFGAFILFLLQTNHAIHLKNLSQILQKNSTDSYWTLLFNNKISKISSIGISCIIPAACLFWLLQMTLEKYNLSQTVYWATTVALYIIASTPIVSTFINIKIIFHQNAKNH